MKNVVGLGDRVRDRINGYTGIATGRAEFLFGCRQVMVAPETIPADGKHPESSWVDEDRLEVVAPSAFVQPDTAAGAGGGPSTSPMPRRK